MAMAIIVVAHLKEAEKSMIDSQEVAVVVQAQLGFGVEVRNC